MSKHPWSRKIQGEITLRGQKHEPSYALTVHDRILAEADAHGVAWTSCVDDADLYWDKQDD